MSRHVETFSAEWQGVKIAITWEPHWLNLGDEYGLDTAHLQVEALAPDRAALPITETGYRSHFTSAATVESYGGPVAFVLAWLAEESAKPAWRAQESSRRQLALF